MSSILVINAAGRETRVALVENGHIAEFYLERKKDKGVVGNIYKGRVVRVLPGMQAAFVDIGLDKAAFLYVSDVVYDPDFARAQFELTEGEHDEADDIPELPEEQNDADAVTHHGQTQHEFEVHELAPGELAPPDRRTTGEFPAVSAEELKRSPTGEHPAVTPAEGTPALTAAEFAAAKSEAAKASAEQAGQAQHAASTQPSGDEQQPSAHARHAGAAESASEQGRTEVSGAAQSTELPGTSSQQLAPGAAGQQAAAGTPPRTTTGELLVNELQRTTTGETPLPGTEAVTKPMDAAELASAAAAGGAPAPQVSTMTDVHPEFLTAMNEISAEARARQPVPEQRPAEQRGERRAPKDQRAREHQHGKGKGGRRDEEKEAKRPAKEQRIEELLKVGQEVVVQISKDPIGTKGARLTSHISIPGRHLVFMPTVDHVGISRRITNEKERRRLRDLVDKYRPPGTGFIVRTVAENVPAEKLESDIRFLIEIWNQVVRENEKRRGPGLLHADLDLILRATRDLFAQDVEKLVIDDRDEYERILQFVASQDSALKERVICHDGDEPIFDAYGIEQEIQRAVQRKVWLKSGGYLIIDQAEALTAIDVNSGRYVGKKSLEETITKINVEAAKEIVYQLRLRNIGGIIICDFIDMEKSANRDKVFKALQEALGRDKAKTNVLKISELGLVEMTRKRVRESIGRVLHEDCAYCDGKGYVKTPTTIAYEIFREIRREAPGYKDPTLVINCNLEVARVLQAEERDELRHLMDRFNKSIQVKQQQNYHREQYDIYGRTAQGQDHKVAGSTGAVPDAAGFGLPPQRRDQNGGGGGGERRFREGGRGERGERGDREGGGGGGGGGRDRDRNRGRDRDRNRGQNPQRQGGDKPRGERGQDRGGQDRGGQDRGGQDRGGQSDRGASDRGGQSERGGQDRGASDRGDQADRGSQDRGAADRGGQDRSAADRGGQSGRPERGGQDRGGQSGHSDRGGQDRGGQSDRGQRDRGERSEADRQRSAERDMHRAAERNEQQGGEKPTTPPTGTPGSQES